MRNLIIASIFLVAVIFSMILPLASSGTVIRGVLYRFDVQKIVKLKHSGKSYGGIVFYLTVTFRIANYTDTNLVVPLGIPFVTSSKYKGAVDPKLVSYQVIYEGKNIAESATFIYKPLSRVEIKLSKPITGQDYAIVNITVLGTIKSTSKLYVTKDYKYYKDYKPASNKIMALDIINFWYSTTWCTDTINGEKVPGIRVVVLAPKGWQILYARTSLSSKLRYMDIHKIYEKDDRQVVVLWYLSSKTIKPTSFKPGSVFTIEIGFTPFSDYRSPVTLAVSIILLILAGFFAWYYRDVWKYTTRKTSLQK